MKIAKLRKMCKENGKSVATYYDPVTKVVWIGDGYALYPLYGLPVMTEKEQFLTLLDVPESERKAWKHQSIFGEASNDIQHYIHGCTYNNELINQGKLMSTSYVYRVFDTPQGIHFIKQAYVDIIDDPEDEQLSYHYINNAIVVTAGVVVLAIIFITKHVVNEAIIKDYTNMLKLIKRAYENDQREREEIEKIEQTTLND